MNKRLKEIIKNYQFLYVHEKLEFNQDPIIFQNFKDSKIAIINQIKETSQNVENNFLIICFKNTIIIINQESILFLLDLFTSNPELTIYFLSNTKDIFDDNKIFIKNKKYDSDDIFLEEINNFNEAFTFKKMLEIPKIQIWNVIRSSLSGYLIKQSYEKLNKNRFENFIKSNNFEVINFNDKDYIELRNIDKTILSNISLVYYIEKGELLVVKKPTSIESTYLIKREQYNYSIINYPFFPKYYGIYEEKEYLFIEFINGKNLNHIQSFGFNYNDKISIIFQIILIFKYIHGIDFVYRDLKPNNVMIDENKNVVLLDFDRMIPPSKFSESESSTKDFSHIFVSPEVNYGKISYKNDIYSLGKMIYYIITEELPNQDKIRKLDPKIKLFYDRCTNKNPRYRPCIKKLFIDFYDTFESFIHKDIIEKNKEILYCLGNNYYNGNFISRNINKAIHFFKLASDLNHIKSQNTLGHIYHDGIYISKDISKAIYYYQLAADQNNLEAQIILGNIYYNNKYVPTNINKAIYYYTLASNQNNVYAQYNLGEIYYGGLLIQRDINKAIHFYSLAADINNYAEAQYSLGIIYSDNEYIPQDLNKAIHYYTLASNQKHSKSQYNLGIIYSDNKYIPQDLNKAIHYYTLASNQNHSKSQYNLGFIYFNNKNSLYDINKAIYYFKLAANLNNVESQFALGVIYISGDYIQRNVEKAVHYFTLAANQNHSDSQLNLGSIYFNPLYAIQDIKKSIYYYQLAANKNIASAQYMLGNIYSANKYVPINMEKAIYYYQLAANQNCVYSQYNLGIIYLTNKYAPRNINKSIYYFTLAAKQNLAEAQNNLGYIYKNGLDTTKDIYKAIYYYQLAANQNCPNSQYELGIFYLTNKYVPKDIKKSIHYLTLAANQNFAEAQYGLGIIYEKDVNKSIHYLTLAANQNHSEALFKLGFKYFQQDIYKAIHYFTLSAKYNNAAAQCFLGLLYFYGYHVQRCPNKAINLLTQSTANNNIYAYFILGFIYHEGKYLKPDIHKSIHYYKYASSFNNQYAKNNLGILYKNGFGDEVSPNIEFAIEYFKEAIRQKNDSVSMYNLAHLYFYNNPNENNINESIDLLIKSYKLGFLLSIYLLCLALIKKYGNDLKIIKKELDEHSNDSYNLSQVICQKIKSLNIRNSFIFYYLNDYLRNVDFLYGPFQSLIQTNDKNIKELNKNLVKNEINSDFYDGFGL